MIKHYQFNEEKKMFYPLIILFSAIALVTLLIVKLPLMLWYRRFKMMIWHHFIIWKIEQRMQKASKIRENSLQGHQQSEGDISRLTS